MKIIHCADIHLGSPLTSIADEEKRKERQAELRTSFSRMADFAVAKGVSAVIIAGDLFDREKPFRRDTDFFYSAVKAHREVDFLYLRGNHDTGGSLETVPDNLKFFGDCWTSYVYGDINICGTELTSSNCSSVYSTYVPDPERYNIAVLHGQLCDKADECSIDRRLIRGRGIDYLALGHVHSFSAENPDSRCSAVYSGCLEGRGWDEPGDCGFVLIESTESGLSYEFVPFSCRRAVIRRIDISGCSHIHEVYAKVMEEAVNDGLLSRPACNEDMLRVELSGSPANDMRNMCAELRNMLSESFWNVTVKDYTKPPLCLGDWENELSLRAEFIRTVMNDSSYTDEERRTVLTAGLQALSGEAIEI